MHLHHKLFGAPSSPPLMLIHGLFGSWENLKPLIKILTPYYHIIAIDARNHGQSPHDSSMTYTDMAQDIEILRTTLGIDKFGILGHSMGGKIAMQVALTNPQNIQHLTVIDIAPKPYPPHHAAIIKAIGRIQLTDYTTKTQVAEALSSDIPNMALRQFLVKNIVRCN
ncbi:MAG: alpha/beta fold hydrolase, partial [Candidatus Marinamargulisbacteria bacterium]